MNYLHILLTFLFSASSPLFAFTNISQAKKYTAQMPEFPAANNNKYPTDPDYSEFHKMTMPTLFQHIKNKLHLTSSSIWDAHEFKKNLEKITAFRRNHDLSGSLIQKICTDKPLKIFIWGDIEGSLHSFVRDLEYLNKEKIINDDFIIQNKDHYFVLNGDTIDRSPYILETLTLAITLLDRNPNQFIFIRGEHESNNYWHNFGLKRELQIRARHLDPSSIPLGETISAFFNTLPLACYVQNTTAPANLLRISHSDRTNSMLNEQNFSEFFFDTKKTGISFFKIENGKPAKKPVDIRVIIKTEAWMKENRSRQGLGLLDQDEGATSWAVLSSNTEMAQTIFKSYFDAFAVVDFRIPLEQSTIELIHRDSRTRDPFSKEGPYNIITGHKTTPDKPQYERGTYVISSIMGLLRGVPMIAERTKRGMSTCINEANSIWTSDLPYIRTFIYNDDYSPFKARQYIKKFINDDMRTILLPIGSPTLEAYIDTIKKGDISVFFPITGGPQFRDPNLKNLIHLRTSYKEEVQALIGHLYQEYSVRKFAFFYQNDAYGEAPLAEAEKELKKRGITEITKIPYSRGAINFTKQIDMLRQAQPEALGLFSTAIATQEFFRQISFEELTNQVIFGISFLGEQSFRNYIEKRGIKVIFSSVVPSPCASQLPIAKEYRAVMNKNFYPYDVFSFEGYIATRIFLYAMSMTKDKPTRESIMKILESFKDHNFEGLNLTFDPQTRGLSKSVWIETEPCKEWLKTEFP